MVFVLKLSSILLAQKPICSPVTKSKHVNYKLTSSDFNNIWLSELSYCPSGGYWAAGGAILKSNNEECLINKQPLDIAWDGKYQGEYVPDGIYIYIINGMYLDPTKNYRQITKNGVLMVLDGGK